jgi:hypothetical protein
LKKYSSIKSRIMENVKIILMESWWENVDRQMLLKVINYMNQWFVPGYMNHAISCWSLYKTDHTIIYASSIIHKKIVPANRNQFIRWSSSIEKKYQIFSNDGWSLPGYAWSNQNCIKCHNAINYPVLSINYQNTYMYCFGRYFFVAAQEQSTHSWVSLKKLLHG